MRLTVFSRLILGYFTMFAIIGGVNAYALVKLHQLNAETSRIVNVDQRLLELRKGLADAVLVQMAFERKYTITGEPVFRERLSLAEGDFDRLLAEALRIADGEQKQGLERITDLYAPYRSLVDRDVEGVARKGRRGATTHEQEKGRLGDAVLVELKKLDALSNRQMRDRISGLKEAGGYARRLSLIMWSCALLVVTAAAFFTTRSITRPMSVLIAKTREVSAGLFKGDLAIASPPELALVAEAFNVMCDRLQRVEKMKAAFLSAMSHELRTPLTSIKEGIGLLQDGAGGPITEKQERLLKILSQETRRLIDLVNSLLDLSKMEAGMMEYRFGLEDIALLARAVVAETAPLTEAKKLQVETDIGEGIPPVRVDRERICQAMRNLIGNAIKFTPPGGGIRVTLKREEGGVRASVTDTGPGIPRESGEAVFEEFHQLPVRDADWPKGTGLGLALVKQIITAHGGRVWVESEPGKGSTFVFFLPS